MSDSEGLFRDIKNLYITRAKYFMEKWNRLLPFNEMIVDRWEKAKLLGFGESSSIYDSSFVLGSVKVGKNTWIGPFTMLDGTGGLEIGSFCSVSSGVQIYTHDSIQWALSGGRAEYEYAPVKIGDRCYIGPNAVIAKGVTIGSGTVIGACSLVLNDIPENSKALGSPCKVVGTITHGHEK